MTDTIETALTAGSFAAFPLMLFGGFVSGLNPCCVALYPAAALTCCGARGRAARQTFSAALAFTVGLALATAAVGTVAAVAGRVTATSLWFRYAIAAVPVVMGIHLLGWLRLPIPSLSATTNRQRLGAAFGSGLLGSGMTVMMNCPMMSKAPGRQMGGGNLRQGMMAMFGLSPGEVSSALTANKDALGLTDAQVKEIATSIASLQQQKLETGMQKMMGQMMAGTMKCPCMQGDSK